MNEKEQCSSTFTTGGAYSEVVPCGRPGPHDGAYPYGLHRTAGGHWSWSAASEDGGTPPAKYREPSDWCYTCEQFHGPMGWGAGCTDDRDLAREQVRRRLPWAPSFGFLTGRQCRARLPRAIGVQFGRWGRCELRNGHVSGGFHDNPEVVDHALEFGAIVLRWQAWRAIEDAEPYIEEGLGR